MLDGIKGRLPGGEASQPASHPPADAPRSASPPPTLPAHGELSLLAARRAAARPADTGHFAGASGSAVTGTMASRGAPPRLAALHGPQARDLAASDVPAEVRAALEKMLVAADPQARTAPEVMAALVDEAQQAVCHLLRGSEVPPPAAAQAAARALMAGIQALPDKAARADRAAARFLDAFAAVPRPRAGGQLPGYGERLEGVVLAILEAATLVPEGERLKGLDVLARLPGTQLDRMPQMADGPPGEKHLKPLLDSVARARHAVLSSIETLSPSLRSGPLTGLAEQAKYVQFGMHRAGETDRRNGWRNLYPGAALDLLASLSRLPVEHRREPLNALSASLAVTPMFNRPKGLQLIRDRLQQAALDLQQPVDAGFAARLREQTQQLVEGIYLHQNDPAYRQVWKFIDFATRLWR